LGKFAVWSNLENVRDCPGFMKEWHSPWLDAGPLQINLPLSLVPV
jgi:hypothetical protein